MTDRRPPATRLTPRPGTRHLTVYRRRPRQGGFNFSEVLFAVMILGIGFIMIAAIFPVALQQTKLTGEEVNAASSGRSGVNFVQQIGKVTASLPVTRSKQIIPANSSVTLPGAVYTFRDDRIAIGPDGVGPPITVNDPDGSGAQDALDLRDRVWKDIAGKLILPSDNRQAWVALYRRGATYTNTDGAAHEQDYAGANPIIVTPAAFAQVFVIGLEVRNRSIYDPIKDINRYTTTGVTADLAVATNLPPATLEGRTVYVKLAEGNTNPDTVQFFNGPLVGATALPDADNCAAEGAFIVISDDQALDNGTTAAVEGNGWSNGRIYRVGNKRDDLGVGVYELAPGWDMPYVNPNGTVNDADDVNWNIPPRNLAANTLPANYPIGGIPAIAIMVGRGCADPTVPVPHPNGVFEGAAQEISVYTSFVPAN